MENILKTLEEHKNLLNNLGYTLDIKKGEIPLYKPINILNDKEIVGKLSIEYVNLYFIKKDKKIVCNMDLNSMFFGKNKQKNTKTLFHIVINDKNENFDCYNKILNNTDDYIGIKNSKIFIIEKNNMISEIQCLHDENPTKILVNNDSFTVIKHDEDNVIYSENNSNSDEAKDALLDILGNNSSYIVENLINTIYDNPNEKKKVYKSK